MDDEQSAKQIAQMVNFILNEAKDKAEEIEAKTLEDFNIEKLKQSQAMKDKIRVDIDKKKKKMMTTKAIERSTKINQARLQKIEAQQQSMADLGKMCDAELKNYARDRTKYQPLLVDLIVQAALKLMEDKMIVRCKRDDQSTVAGVLQQASQKYAQVIKRQTGKDKVCAFDVDKNAFLDATSAGGVIVMTQDGLIKVDNTLDARLKMCMKEDLPAIRKICFPKK